MAPSPFAYSLLPDAKTWIRVIDVHPAENSGSEFHLTLRDVQLDTAYNCLSYTWGNGSADCQIIIDGASFMVRRNLMNFLQQYRERRTEETLPIWIDAITIDQQNILEKNDQVALMGQIYRRAQNVIIWLGDNDKRIERAFKFINKRTNIEQTHDGVSSKFPLVKRYSVSEDLEGGDREEEMRRQERKFKRILTYMAQVPLEKYWEAFDAISSSPYFNRLWIIQEILLAKEVDIWYDSLAVDETSMANLCMYIELVFPSSMEDPAAYSRARSTFCGRTFHDRSHERYLPTTRLKPVEQPDLDFDVAFQMYHDHLCANLKDKVYGLLSLGNDMTDFGVDYDALSELLVPDIYQRSKAGHEIGFLMIKELSLSHEILFQQTKDMFSGRYWGFEITDVGIVDEVTQTSDSYFLDVDWENLTLPERSIGEYCQYIEQVEVRRDPSTSAIRPGDLLLRPPHLNGFFLFRAEDQDKSSTILGLIDDIFERTPESKTQMSRADADMLSLELAHYKYISTLTIDEGHRDRVHEDPDEEVGANISGPLKLAQSVDLALDLNFQRSIFGSDPRHFYLKFDWKCMLSLWEFQDRPGLVRNDSVSDQQILAWQKESRPLSTKKAFGPTDVVKSKTASSYYYWNGLTGRKEPLVLEGTSHEVVSKVVNGKKIRALSLVQE